MCTLKDIAKHHKEYISIAVSFGAKNEAEDIVQEVYLKIDKYNYYQKLSKDGNINKSYMWMLIKSVWMDSLKHSTRLNTFSIGEGFEIKHESNDYDKESLLKLEEFIDSLDWYSKRMLNIFIDGKSMRQISKETGIGLRSVWTTINQAKDKLRKEL